MRRCSSRAGRYCPRMPSWPTRQQAAIQGPGAAQRQPRSTPRPRMRRRYRESTPLAIGRRGLAPLSCAHCLAAGVSERATRPGQRGLSGGGSSEAAARPRPRPPGQPAAARPLRGQAPSTRQEPTRPARAADSQMRGRTSLSVIRSSRCQCAGQGARRRSRRSPGAITGLTVARGADRKVPGITGGGHIRTAGRRPRGMAVSRAGSETRDVPCQTRERHFMRWPGRAR